MITQIDAWPSLTADIRNGIESLKPYTAAHWKSRKKIIIAFKNYVREQLRYNQDCKCAYCGLEIGETSYDEIEHIAPKGAGHPEYIFTPENLVLACSLCNGFTKKGTLETIARKSDIYQECEFLIVHPYFDDPDEHYCWVDEGKRVLIQHATNKGEKTIKMFKLDSSRQALARSRQIRWEEMYIDSEIQEWIIAASTYRGQ